MKHSKHIARIVAFALLAVTMIGSFIGCKNAAGGYDGPYLTGLYADAPYPEEGKESFYIILMDFKTTPRKVQGYFIEKDQDTHGSVLFHELFTKPVAYELSDNTIVFKDVVLARKNKDAPQNYSGRYNEATDTIDIPNEFPGRSPGGFTTVSFTTEDYFKLKPAFIPLSDKNYMDGPYVNGDGVTCCWFMEHDAVNKTMQLYFVGKEQSGGLKTYPKFGKMENGTWVASPAFYEDTGKGTLRFKNVWVVKNNAPVDFEITYGKSEGITLPDINAGFGENLFLSATDKNYLDPNVSWE